MVVNGLFKWNGYENTRFASVLGRIAISSFFAAIIFLNCNLRSQLIWFGGLLLGYWAIMMLIPVPGYGAGVLTPEGNLAAYIDRLLLPGKLHRKVYDPEGILSNIPAVATALLGIFTGQFLRMNSEKWSMLRKSIAIGLAGIALLVLGAIWNLAFPINKNMWTSSFVLYAGGWSLILLFLFYLVIDVLGLKRWSMPFVWIGTNSILIYMASHGIISFEATASFLFSGLIQYTPELWHEVWLGVGILVVQLVLLYFLFRKKWFLKV
jgi:predicted acyltransferase